MSDSEDFESAGEEDFQTKDKASKKKTAEVENDKKPNKTSDWEDFDDWEDTSDVKQELKSSYDAFPVLSSIDRKEKPEIAPKEEVVKPKEEKVETPSSGWGWGGMMSSLLSTATESVSSITSGLSSVIENSIGGIPEPEDMARMNAEEKAKEGVEDTQQQSQTSTILQNPMLKNIVYGVTGIGSKVINGGLDNLEDLGKKTMNILNENDSPLLIKNNLMRVDGNKPNLSEILREAKVKSEEIEKNLKQMQKNSYKRQLHFESLFDSYYGLVHLEALEMLSKQTSLKLQSLVEPLSGKALVELEETLTEVKELCDLGDMESIGDDIDGDYDGKDLTEKLNEAIEDLGVKIDFKEILSCWTTNIKWLEDNSNAEPQEVYEKGLRCLAETCALCITKMHKIAELLLIIEHHSTANEADSLVQLTQVFCLHLHGVANKFGGKLNAFEKTEDTSSLITSIFVEVFNSSTYVQNAFQLLVPILQIGAA
ncbi:FAM114A2 family protein [Megaselia abdita]